MTSFSTIPPSPARHVVKVVIAGAGPSGLLTALHFLRRNEENSTPPPRSPLEPKPIYSVTLIDIGQDFGILPQHELVKHRSWMIGLACHGLEALREVPELSTPAYIDGVGVKLEAVAVHIGSRTLKVGVGADDKDQEGYIVDRNYICAALARYLTDAHTENGMISSEKHSKVKTMYNSKILYVDPDTENENRRVLVRDMQTNTESYVSYDLLIGCDGLRSVVREAIVRRHREIEMSVGDIFQQFKAVHIKRPESVSASCMHLLPNCLPLMQGIALPETGDMINLSMGVARHNFDALPAELKSSDVVVVANYMKENFKAFVLDDYHDFATQFIKIGKWNVTGSVHVTCYHSLPLRAIIMGDAAHATSPSIGMGMNTALKDASVLNRLLDEYEDDLEAVLPAFSNERVKEGNALTDMAEHLFCLSSTQQAIESIHMLVRSVGSRIAPRFISKHPQEMLGMPRYKLSDVYDHAVKLGIITKHRAINDKIRRDYFEKKSGMVVKANNGASSWKKKGTLLLLVVLAALAVVKKRQVAI